MQPQPGKPAGCRRAWAAPSVGACCREVSEGREVYMEAFHDSSQQHDSGWDGSDGSHGAHGGGAIGLVPLPARERAAPEVGQAS